ncbi:tonB-system energizer ExbB [Paracoccus pacificus]|uniref:Biopolymer transport protein ExbB n=1 Tax=Paracoccus pacificus TaxID=1463598 RepID=A0ABW4RBF2_9RHOB
MIRRSVAVLIATGVLCALPAAAQIATTGATADVTAGATPGTLPHDLSPWGMFMAADVVVKAVMIGLALASVLTWTIALMKFAEILRAIRTSARIRQQIARAGSLRAALPVLDGTDDPVARMLRAASDEVAAGMHDLPLAGPEGIKERAASSLERIEAGALRRLGAGTGLLATIGATAPFVGLFGTVWGIMNAFVGISKAQTTNLAVVAPGIAEALLATALGLVAAIPAVVIYNFCARGLAAHRSGLRDAAALIERLTSRALDAATGGAR